MTPRPTCAGAPPRAAMPPQALGPFYFGPNFAVCCAEHKGSADYWERIAAREAADLRRQMERLGLISPTEPLCESCRAILRGPC